MVVRIARDISMNKTNGVYNGIFINGTFYRKRVKPMARIGKFVAVREVLNKEITDVVRKYEAAIKAENLEMAIMWKGFRDTLNLINDIVKEKEGKVENE